MSVTLPIPWYLLVAFLWDISAVMVDT